MRIVRGMIMCASLRATRTKTIRLMMPVRCAPLMHDATRGTASRKPSSHNRISQQIKREHGRIVPELLHKFTQTSYNNNEKAAHRFYSNCESHAADLRYMRGPFTVKTRHITWMNSQNAVHRPT